MVKFLKDNRNKFGGTTKVARDATTKFIKSFLKLAKKNKLSFFTEMPFEGVKNKIKAYYNETQKREKKIREGTYCSKTRSRWLAMYEQLVNYKNEHKTTVVKGKHNERLQDRVRRQRNCKEQWKIDELDKIEFDWGPKGRPVVL